MFEITDKVIKITKGDSAAINVQLKNADGSTYTMRSGDKLYFSVRKKIGADLLAEIQSTTNIIDITPTQSRNFEIGACFYDIELRTSAGDIFTVIGVRDWNIPNMVVYAEVTTNE